MWVNTRLPASVELRGENEVPQLSTWPPGQRLPIVCRHANVAAQRPATDHFAAEYRGHYGWFPGSTDREVPVVDIHKFAQQFALVFSHSSVYGANHKVTTGSIKSSYQLLSNALEQDTSVSISVVDDVLNINQSPIRTTTPAIKALIERLTLLGIASFSLQRGLTADSYHSVIELLHASAAEMKEAGGFGAVVKALGIPNVEAKRVFFQQVTEDDIVVSKEKLAEKVGITPGSESELIRFLEGKSEDLDGKAAAKIEAVTKDPSVVADAVMQASDASEVIPDEEKVENLVGCVKRLYAQLSKGPRAKTQKGKKELLKFFNSLEKDITSKLDSEAGVKDEAVLGQVANVFEEMTDALTIDSLVAEYGKKQGAIEKSETRLLRYIKAKGEGILSDSAFLERLEAEGVSKEKLNELLGRSGIAVGDEAVGDAARVLKVLTSLAAQVEEQFGTDGAGGGSRWGEGVDGMVGSLAAAVSGVATKAETVVAAFAKKAEQNNGLTKKDILEFLAEMGQELRQPLSVINCTLSLVGEGSLGAVTDQQKKMISLATDSAQRLEHLTDKLVDISGVPMALVPDSRILGDMYDR